MNIKFISGYKFGENGITETNTLDLALCGQGRPEGSAAGLVPVKLATGVVVTPMVTVTSNTSTTKRNSRSAVIKVSLPYTALTKDADGNTVADPSRSGADLSIHVVLALPASAAKDIKGINGDTSRQAAEAQVALVKYLLSSLIGQQFGSDPGYLIPGGSEGTATVVLEAQVPPAPAVGGDGSSVAVDTSVAAPLPSANVDGYSGAGFDLTGVMIRKDLNSALGRIANGLPALSCADVVAYATRRTIRY